MPVRWGIIGCGDVTEVKRGPALQKAAGSELLAVMRRDRAKAEDYARRHGVPRAYDRAADLIADPAVDAVYVATPPSSHLALARAVAEAGKPCLVEKPMAMHYGECREMIETFAARDVPLWVAYYRRALPRFLEVREQLARGDIGTLTSVHVQITDRLASGETLSNWRFDPSIAGAGLFLDLASHCVDLLDFLVGPIADARGFAVNAGGAYASEDVTATAFVFRNGVVGTGIFNFNADAKTDVITFTGTGGTLATPVFSDTPPRNPPHVHQPLVQTIVDELAGRGRCESTGESGARASWVMDRCLESYRIVQGSMNSMRVPSGS
jgi:1,5-anhydro-D-fructose reductase (1,5-anhydro-D-mannitol-forming)